MPRSETPERPDVPVGAIRKDASGWSIDTGDLKVIAALVLGVVAVIAAIFVEGGAQTAMIGVAGACGGFIAGHSAPSTSK